MAMNRSAETAASFVAPSNIDQEGFYLDVIDEISEPGEAVPFPTEPDNELSQWLERSIANSYAGSLIETDHLLEGLNTAVPQISSATACVAYASDLVSLKNTISRWAEDISSDYEYLTTHVFVDDAEQQLGCAAVAVHRLPRFSPDTVNSGEKSFYSICPICGHSHIGTIQQTNGAAALNCPNCGETYELLAFKMDGKVARVNDLLEGWEPPVKVPRGLSRLEEMMFIWKTVVDHVRYSEDFRGLNQTLDTWQLARETWEYQNGDCEDSSILLADWLIREGFDARVVIGTTDEQEGHAWCVVSLKGTSYILETTNARPDIRQLPYAATLGKHYLPKFQFNRESVFYKKTKTDSPRYWSRADWHELAAQ